MPLEKPGWAQWFLGLINIPKLEIMGVTIFPGVRIGDIVEEVIDWLIEGVNFAWWLAEAAWSGVAEAISIALGALTKIDDWLLSAVNWFYDQIDDWWAWGFQLVKDWGWALIGAVAASVDILWDFILGIDDWLVGKLGPVWEWVIAQLADVYDFTAGLIAGAVSEVKDWVKDYVLGPLIPFVAVCEFWWNFGENVVAFFSNSAEWILVHALEPLIEDFLDGFNRAFGGDD